MLQLQGDDFNDIYKDILSHLFQTNTIRAKFVSDYSLMFVLNDPIRSILVLSKNWSWAFHEGLNRLSFEYPELQNPGTAYQFRGKWNQKLKKEGGRFCYSYGEALSQQLTKSWYQKLRTDQREQIISIWDPVLAENGAPRRPCTLTYHFMVTEEKKLDLHVNMRTSDVANLLPYDVFHACLLQIFMGRKKNLKLGKLYFYSSFFYFHKKRMATGSLKRAHSNINKEPLNFIQPNYTEFEFQKLIKFIQFMETKKYKSSVTLDEIDFQFSIQDPFLLSYQGAILWSYDKKFKVLNPVNRKLLEGLDLYQFEVINLKRGTKENDDTDF